MRRRMSRSAALAVGVLLAVSGAAFGQGILGAGTQLLDVYQPLIIGDYVDPFRYSGEGVRPLDGAGVLDVDPLSNEGLLKVELKTTAASGPVVIGDGIELLGTVTLVMDEFLGIEPYMQGGIAQYLLMHGDTGLMSSVFPELLVELVGWGKADLYLNGELFYAGLVSHFMLADRIRRGPEFEEPYAIWRASDSAIYSPRLESKAGFAFSNEKALYLFVANSLAGIESGIGEDLELHVDLLVRQEPLALAAGGGGSTPEDPVDDPDNPDGSDGKQKGNNGIGNGDDPQPPGNPPINDGPGSSPGGGKKPK